MRAPLLAACIVAVALLGGCEQKLTMENYDQIKEGMTLSEVESLLGEGERQDSGGTNISSGGVLGSSSSINSSVQTYLWKEEDRQIIIDFKDGKLVTKRKTGFE